MKWCRRETTATGTSGSTSGGRSPTSSRSRTAGRAPPPQGAVIALRPGLGIDARPGGAARRSRRGTSRTRAAAPARDDARDERDHRAPAPDDGARHHGGVPGRARDRRGTGATSCTTFLDRRAAPSFPAAVASRSSERVPRGGEVLIPLDQAARDAGPRGSTDGRRVGRGRVPVLVPQPGARAARGSHGRGPPDGVGVRLGRITREWREYERTAPRWSTPALMPLRRRLRAIERGLAGRGCGG